MVKAGEVTTKTLEATPTRALNFLLGVSASAAIYEALRARGYSPEEHRLGWSLLAETGALHFQDEILEGRTEASAALIALDDEDERVFGLVRACLEFEFADQAAMLLDGLSSARGAVVVLHMARLLERMDALDASTHEQDRKAMAKLAVRGIGRAQRARLAALVKQAQALPTVEPHHVRAGERQIRHKESLMRLRAWHNEWSGVARACISRRDYFIRLGMASRRPKNGSELPSEAS